MTNRSKSKKIFLLYLLIAVGFSIFLGVMLITVLKPRHLPSLYSKNISKAQRGSIISADGFHIATTKKLYKAMVNTRYIDPDKKELFIELFSIYSGISSKKIRKKLKRNGVVVLSYEVEEKTAQSLKKLAFVLREYRVFMQLKSKRTGKLSIHGLNIVESGESRTYPYGDIFTPIIGFTTKIENDDYTVIVGKKGIEKRFDETMGARQNELRQGKRDVSGYIILNKDSFSKEYIDGLSVVLNIPVSLQIKMEKMLDTMKKELKAKEIMLAVMQTKDGKVISLASSNRFLPKKIRRRDYSSLNSGVAEYSFEPGSVIKPITFALLLDKGLTNPYELVDGHNGRFKIGRKIITDEHKFRWLSAENVIIQSSNVGIAQLAQKLSGIEFHNGLKSFGFSKKSTPDMYERKGTIPNSSQLEDEIYKATVSYGYGMRANLMQLLHAYSIFNNNGRGVTPRIVSHFKDYQGRVIPIQKEKQIQVIKSSTANKLKKILIKTVNKGTGTGTKMQGLVIGGKTGTAHMVEKGQYVSRYNSSFLGFVNDSSTDYTMGVIVVEPSDKYFASQTAVPVFKKAIEVLIEEGLLKPKVIK